jgi:hypothetical protein
MPVGNVRLIIVGCALIAAATLAPIAASASGAPNRTSSSRASAGSDNVICTSTETTNVPDNLTIPVGATCTIAHTVTVGNNVIVDQGATLIDRGATIENNITATQPKGIGIGGYAGHAGYVSTSITIHGLTGQGPGTVTKGGNYICNTNIGNNVTVENTAGGAGEWIIGDRHEECSGGTDQLNGSLIAINNNTRVDISDIKKGHPPYSVGIGYNLVVTGNLVNSTSPIVESNFVGNNATCQPGTKEDADGTPNIVDGKNNGCP